MSKILQKISFCRFVLTRNQADLTFKYQTHFITDERYKIESRRSSESKFLKLLYFQGARNRANFFSASEQSGKFWSRTRLWSRRLLRRTSFRSSLRDACR